MEENRNSYMERQRVFVAIDFPSEVIKEIARVQEILGNLKFSGKMTELENLHLTLKFLGEIDNDKLKEVEKRLLDIKLEKFESRLNGIGIFSYHGNPRIVWIKIGGKGIFELQKKIDEILADLFKPEERFMSHMTIARVKYARDKIGFKNFIEGIKLKDIKFKVDKFMLKESELMELGPIYRDLESYLLK